MDAKLDVNDLQKKMIELGYADTRDKAKFAIAFVCAGDYAGLATVLRYGGAYDNHKDALVMAANVRDAAALIQWHNKANATPWVRDDANELEQVWRITNGYDAISPDTQAPPRQRDAVAMAVKRLRDQAEMFQKLARTTHSKSDEDAFEKLAATSEISTSLKSSLERAQEVTKMNSAYDVVVAYLANYFQAVHGATGIDSVDTLYSRAQQWLRNESRTSDLCQLFDCAPNDLFPHVSSLVELRKQFIEELNISAVNGTVTDAEILLHLKSMVEFAKTTLEAVKGGNMPSGFVPTVVKEFRAIFGEDFEVAMNRLQEVDKLIGSLGGWDDAEENLAKLDKAAGDLVNIVTILRTTEEDRDAWRKVALNLFDGKAT